MPDNESKTNYYKTPWHDYKFLLAVGLIIASCAAAFYGLKSSLTYQEVSGELGRDTLQKQIDKKVDQKEYEECIKRLESSIAFLQDGINRIETSQRRMESKMDLLTAKKVTDDFLSHKE